MDHKNFALKIWSPSQKNRKNSKEISEAAEPAPFLFNDQKWGSVCEAESEQFMQDFFWALYAWG